jgi:hypothetical protein
MSYVLKSIVARRGRSYGLTLLVLAAFSVFAHGTCEAQSTASRMLNVVRKFVQQTGNDVVGLGSWIRGGQYRDVLTVGDAVAASDHDLRLLVPPGVGPEEAALRWRNSRQQFIRLINEEFGQNAGKVLEKTNLYPPNQLLAAVEDAEDATRLFVRNNQVPNLGYSKAIDSNIPQKFTEGLYGNGAQAWTQAYERNAGMRFYNVKGNVFTSGTQYLHTLEGQAKVSSAGMANTARQWIEHAASSIDSNDAKSVGKYLERVERDLSKSRALIGVAADETWKAEMQTLASQLRSSPSSLSSLNQRITQALQRASMESAILARVEGSSATQRAALRAILGAIQGGDDLGRKILELSGKIPIDKLMDAIIAAIAAREMGIALGEEDYAKAIAALGLAGDPFFIGVLAQITHQSLEAAKDAGATLVGYRQGCEDLMAGIFSGGAFEAEGRSYTHDQLFEEFKEERGINAFVMARATEASARELGIKTAAVDRAVAQAKFDKCYPLILATWNSRRQRLADEYAALRDELASAPLMLSYAPLPLGIDPKTGKATARVSVVEAKNVNGIMRRMKEIGKQLTGEIPTVYYFYSWSEGGKATKNQEQHIYEYEAPGFYTVELTRTLVSAARGQTASFKSDERIELTQGVDITVEGREADGTYEGTLTLDAVRLVNGKGESTELDMTKAKVINEVKCRLTIKGAIATMHVTASGAEEGSVFTKMSGAFIAEKNEVLLSKVDSYDFHQPAIKKLEMNYIGHLKGADAVSGTFKAYIAAEVPSTIEGETEVGFVHASGKWTAKLKVEPTNSKTKGSGNTPKPKSK